MRKRLLLIAIALMPILTIAQVPNAGFETWASGNPTDWLTTNIPGFATPITQATPSHSGSYAAKGQAVDYQGQIFAPVLASMSLSGTGFPVTQLYANLDVWYKTNLVGTDLMTVGVLFMDGSGMTLAAGAVDVTTNSSAFTQLTVPVQYLQAGTPASCIITITCSDAGGNEPDVNTWFVVDDLTLSGTLSGINEVQANQVPILVYPNPANNVVNVRINATDNSANKLLLFNINGQRINEYSLESTQTTQTKTIDVSTLTNGLYFLRTDGNSSKSAIMVVNH